MFVSLHIAGFATHGTGLIREIAATAAGLLGGLAASALMRVYRSPRTGKAVSRAGRLPSQAVAATHGARTTAEIPGRRS